MNKSKFLRMVENFASTQKQASKIFGVQESTYNQWLKEDRIPEHAKIIINLMLENSDLNTAVSALREDRGMYIPVQWEGETLLIKLYDDLDAIYQYSLKGRVVTRCTDVDNSSDVLDSLNEVYFNKTLDNTK